MATSINQLTKPITKLPKIGIIIAIGIMIFISVAFLTLINFMPNFSSIDLSDGYYWHITTFSLWQATLSMVISVALAIPIALSLSRRNFFGKKLILKIFAITLVLPSLVGVFGLLAVYGRQGIIIKCAAFLGIDLNFSIYGLVGIVFAHVFFNLPYAVYLLWQALANISSSQHKLCEHLGMSYWDKLRLVEWQVIKQCLPQIMTLIFILCFTSFAVVMALGGSPKATTIELAIYQAIKFDFDLATGAILALWQMLICSIFAIIMQCWQPLLVDPNISSLIDANKFKVDNLLLKFWDGIWIVFAILFVLPPIMMVVISGLNSQAIALLALSQFWQALINSLYIAISASFFSLIMAIFLLQTSNYWQLQGKIFYAHNIEWIGSIILITPSLVISAGLFILLYEFNAVGNFTWIIVVIINGLFALPFMIKKLSQPMLQLELQYHKLAVYLNLKSWQRFYIIEFKALYKLLLHTYMIGIILTIGDVSAIAFFSTNDFITLSMYLLQLLGSYQMQAAAVVALCLLLVSFLCFVLVEILCKRRTSFAIS